MNIRANGEARGYRAEPCADSFGIGNAQCSILGLRGERERMPKMKACPSIAPLCLQPHIYQSPAFPVT
jgi:hypothetical protein